MNWADSSVGNVAISAKGSDDHYHVRAVRGGFTGSPSGVFLDVTATVLD